MTGARPKTRSRAKAGKRKALTGNRVIRFIERNLVHTEDPWAGQPFLLLEWQKQVIRDAYDDRGPDGERVCRELYIETGKGNGKSPFIAALGIVELLCQGKGSFVISLAATFAQASETTFRVAKDMIVASPTLQHLCHVQEKRISADGGRRWEVHTSDGSKGKAGPRPTCLILDELQEQQNRKLIDINEANQDKLAIREPLFIVAGNAGLPGTIAHEWHERGQRYMAGDTSPDLEGFKAHIFGLGPTEDWKDRSLWKKANPALGKIITMKALERVFQKALKNPAVERRFRQLNLGQWLATTQTGFLPMDDWAKCSRPLPSQDALKKMKTWIGFDMSDIRDLTAVSQLWVGDDRTVYVRLRHWIPRATAEDYEHKHEIPFREWADAGAVTLTDTVTIDHTVKAEIATYIEDHLTDGVPQVVCYDAYRSAEIVQKLESRSIVCEFIEGTFKGVAEATKELAGRLAAGTIVIEPNPCLQWQASNLHVVTDLKGNVRPAKALAKGKYAGTAHKKIDGVVSLILALARAMVVANALVEQKPAAQKPKPRVMFFNTR